MRQITWQGDALTILPIVLRAEKKMYLVFALHNVKVYVRGYSPTELAHSFYSLLLVHFCLYGPFNYISFHKLSQQVSVFSLCSSGLISALSVYSSAMKVSFFVRKYI